LQEEIGASAVFPRRQNVVAGVNCPEPTAFFGVMRRFFSDGLQIFGKVNA
jgi:hypothetical protein